MSRKYGLCWVMNEANLTVLPTPHCSRRLASEYSAHIFYVCTVMKSNFVNEPFEKRAFRKNQEDLLAFCYCHNLEACSLQSKHIQRYSSLLYLRGAFNNLST